MSFILDALRKSEHERQRQTGPGLAEVPVAAPRTKTSAWATAAVALLIVNLVAIGVLMLRRTRAPEPQAAAVAAAPAPARAQDPAPALSTSATVPAPPATAEAAAGNPAAGTTGVPPMLQPADAAAPGAGTRNPLADEVAEGSLDADPVLAERGASVPMGPPAVTEFGNRPGTVVYESLPGTGGQTPDAAQGLPTIDDAGLTGGLPELHIDLHVYSAKPQDRFVFVNKRKYREGETLQEGPQVEEITRDGVVLSQHGRRFVLPR